MIDTATKTLIVALVLGTASDSSYSYNLENKSYFSNENVILEKFGIRLRRARQSGFNAKCKTPAQPQHGRWIYFDTKETGKADSEVDEGALIIFTCNTGYKLSSTHNKRQYIGCLEDGTWESAMPSCQKLCVPSHNSEIITYTCKIDGQKVPCDQATDGTVRTSKCAAYHEPPPGRPEISTCFRGRWDYPLECVSVCGYENVPAGPLLVGGDQVARGRYPWVTAIYRNKNSSEPPDFQLICSGTLIALNIVLTAAHCVTKKETGEIESPKLYRVAAAKHYLKYEDKRDIDTASYAEIAEMRVHPEYRGYVQNFRGDIALLKLNGEFVASESILPACYVDLPPLPTNTMGLVTGWGYTTETGQLSEELKELKLPYNDGKTCYNSFDTEFARRYFISDKICAGFNNQNRSVCNGDSGGGLLFRNPYYKDRYFIYGIVSLSETFVQNQEQHCNIQRSALFTNIKTYIEFVQFGVQQYKPFKTNCLTPEQPHNGQWTYHNNLADEPNVLVEINTEILFTCNVGYQLSSTNEKKRSIHCTDSGDWNITIMPTCEEMQLGEGSSGGCRKSITKVLGKDTVCSGDEIINYNFSEPFLDPRVWLIEKYYPNEPDWEYVIYTSEPDVLEVRDHLLQIRPKVVEENINKSIVVEGCTRLPDSTECANKFNGIFHPPIVSGRIVSKAAFCFGNITVRAKLPQGDWIYPEIYLETISVPQGKVIIAFARGNKELTSPEGTDIGGRYLLGGPYKFNRRQSRFKYLKSYNNGRHWGEDFHVFTVVWTRDQILLYVDDINYGSINAAALQDTGFNESMVRLVIGVGAGGRNDFPDNSLSGPNPKPWKNVANSAMRAFIKAKDQWLATWNDNSKLQVDYVTITAL